MRPPFDLIVFDWDGTLVDSTATIARCIQYAAADLGLRIPDFEQASHVIGLGLHDALTRAVPDLPPERVLEFSSRYRVHYLARENELELFAGARELIEALRGLDLRLAIATGKSRAGLARALAAELADVHSFIFHTRITSVSEALHDPDPWRAQERLHLLAQGWGGGTRIGESLAQFNREHAARLVHSRTAVLIFSDGYDTGELQRLSDALAQLRRRARRIVWLNPLGGRSDYAPVSQGMQAALPHLDLLSPAGDLAALRAALPALIESLH